MSAKVVEENLKADYIVGVPYGAILLSAFVGQRLNLPFLMRRKEAKTYGTKKEIEGKFKAGQKVVIIEDVLPTGASVIETADTLRQFGLICEEVICILDLGQGGYQNLKNNSLRLQQYIHSRSNSP